MTTSHDDPHGDLLARALHEEAARIVPAGDGLTKIRDRVAGRRTRFRWFLPSASVVTAAALAGVAFGAYTVSNHGDTLGTGQPGQSGSVSGGPSGSERPSITPSASGSSTSPAPPVKTTGQSITPIWPFEDATEAANWTRPNADESWHLDPVATATFFVQSLGFHQHVVTVADSATGNRSGDVTLGTTTTASGRTVTFATVHLVRWGNGDRAAWEITSVTAPGARIDAPAYDGGVYSPTTVRYTLDGGVEEDVRVSLHGMLDDRITRVHQTTGAGQHTARLSYPGMSGQRGFVVLADLQGLSGTTTLTQLAVTPVHFLTPPTSSEPPPPTGTPAYFVAVKDNRLAVFYAKSGGFARWLTAPENPAVKVSSPQLDESHTWVYYLDDPQSLMRVRNTGGTPQPVIVSEAEVDAYAYAGDHDQFQLTVMTGSDGPASPQEQRVGWSDKDTGLGGGFPVPGTPPLVEQGALSRDGTQVALTVRTGTSWQVRIYDTATAKSYDDATVLPCPSGDSCSAPSYDAAGNLYFIAAQDASHWQLLQWTGTKVMHVSTWTLAKQANPETATVDITPDAETALVGTAAGEIYRIEHGKASLLPTAASQPTW